MSSETMARWSTPRVFMAFLLQRGKERPHRTEKSRQVVARDVVAGVHFGEAEARVCGLHALDGFRRKEVRARAADDERGRADLREHLPHVHAELGALAGGECLLELLAKVRVALDGEAA